MTGLFTRIDTFIKGDTYQGYFDTFEDSVRASSKLLLLYESKYQCFI